MEKKGGYQDFPSKTFCLTVPKKFVGEPFFVSVFLVSKTFLEKRGLGEYQEFPSKCFCLTLPKKFVGEPISVSLYLGIDNLYASEG